MPTAALRPCLGRCGKRVSTRRCGPCAAKQDRWRGTSQDRGYGSPWRHFVAYIRDRFVELGIPIVCGASLPDGPDTKAWSRCARDGRINGEALHLDHEPPLTEAERQDALFGDRRAVDDEKRVGWLCSECHRLKTSAQMVGGGIQMFDRRAPNDRPCLDSTRF